MPTLFSRLIVPCLLALCLQSPASRADENDVIVTTCHFGNAEWGSEMIDRCIKHNQAQRAAVLEQFSQHDKLLHRCREKDELGWDWVKTCVERDVAAEAALAAYPSEQAKQIAACRAEFSGHGPARVKVCVDQPQ